MDALGLWTQPSELRSNHLNRLLDEGGVARLMNPATRSRGMRQRDRHRIAGAVIDDVLGTDELVQREFRQKTFDGEPSDWNDYRRADDPKLAFEPVAAAALLLASRNSVAASARMRTGEAPRNRRDVDELASGLFVEPATLQPAEQRAAGASRERDATFRFHLSRSLADQHCPGISRA